MEPPILPEMEWEVSPKGQQIPVSIKLKFDCTNNVIEYEECIVSLQVALEFDAYDLSIFRDSLSIKPETPSWFRIKNALTAWF